MGQRNPKRRIQPSYGDIAFYSLPRIKRKQFLRVMLTYTEIYEKMLAVVNNASQGETITFKTSYAAVVDVIGVVRMMDIKEMFG